MASEFSNRLALDARKPLLRFLTCGSVDDGKSTLLGRLLHDTRGAFDDQILALADDSRRHGTQGDALDFALLLDGLDAEREQRITIDVAYRFFDTERAKFIVADCPGHEQYTRNMATGASHADLAVVLVDARKGVLTQTRRHTHIAYLLGIRHFVLAVNKMDLVGFDAEVFARIAKVYGGLADRLGIRRLDCVPISALHGDNLTSRSPTTVWYQGPSLLDLLEEAAAEPPVAIAGPVRLPVQWVCRPHQDFRGFAGTLTRGELQIGDPVVALPSGRQSVVSGIFQAGTPVARAVAGQPVLVTLTDEIAVGRGDLLVSPHEAPEVADQFAAHVLWMDDRPLLPGRQYLLRLGTATVGAQVTSIRHLLDIDTYEHLAARRLQLNDVAYCNLALDRRLPISGYAQERALGAFVLIDRQTNGTVGAGMIDFALRRASNIRWEPLGVDRSARAVAKGQRPICLWFTGLSGAGKSTLAVLIDRHLYELGYHAFLLDGDNIRHGLTRDLGFTEADRVENIRRIAEVAKLMTDAGLIVLVSAISPFRAERRMARALFPEGEFLEIFVDVSLEVAERRDPKGLYAKARAGLLPNFTGIDSPYERPERPELHLEAEADSPEALAELVVDRLLATLSPGGPPGR